MSHPSISSLTVTKCTLSSPLLPPLLPPRLLPGPPLLVFDAVVVVLSTDRGDDVSAGAREAALTSCITPLLDFLELLLTAGMFFLGWEAIIGLRLPTAGGGCVLLLLLLLPLAGMEWLSVSRLAAVVIPGTTLQQCELPRLSCCSSTCSCSEGGD